MKIIYKVTLTKEERKELIELTKKGTHKSRKIRNALILLNCDEGEYSSKVINSEIVKVLKVSMRTIDRVKKSFIEDGYEICLNGKKTTRIYEKKADGEKATDGDEKKDDKKEAATETKKDDGGDDDW